MKFDYLFSKGNLLAVLIFSIAFWGITYTSDWEGYMYAFNHVENSRDAAYATLSTLFDEHGLDYVDLFHFHIVVMAILYSLLYRQLNLNPILFVLLTLLFNYVGLGNQIRYYTAFPLTIIACMVFYENKNFKGLTLSCLIQVLASYFHSTSIIIYLLFLFSDLVLRRMSKQGTVISVILLNIMLYFVIYKTTLFVDEQYVSYKSGNKTSSFLGGVFNLSPVLLALCFVRKLKSSCNQVICKSYKLLFLYELIKASFPALLLSCFMQIIGSRIVMALLPFYIGFFVLVKRGTEFVSCRKLCNKAIVVVLIYFIIWRFIIPACFDVNGQMLLELIMMLESYKL